MKNQGRFISHIRNGKKVVKEERSVNGLTNLEKPFQAVAALPQDTPLDLAYSVDLTSTPPAPQITLYSIGGVRLKLTYNLNSLTHEDKNRLDSITWTFNQAGRLCKDFKVYANNKNAKNEPQCEDMTSTTDGPVFTAEHSTQGDKETDHTLYWEPKEWNNTLNTTLTTTTHYKSGKDTITGYANGQPVSVDYPKITQTLAIKTRELGPQATGQEHRGNDVKMLEQMLWQLGISPQVANPGSEGARINSDRGHKLTHSCVSGQPQQRDVFLSFSDNNGKCSATELMLKRFNRRNLQKGKAITKADVNATRGDLDDGTIDWLKRDWDSYMVSYTELSSYSVFEQTSAPMALWLAEAADIFRQGSGTYVPPTLTEAIYDTVLTQAGLGTNTHTLEQFLSAWLEEESRYHWGSNNKNYQTTVYRMNEGGADENGSLSFSQILYHYRYGPYPCAAHAEAEMNFYHPKENLKAMVMHAASSNASTSAAGNCKGGFYSAFVNQDILASYHSITQGDTPLMGYRHAGQVNITTLSGGTEDNYEALSKALIAYNTGTDTFKNQSWPELLKSLRRDDSVTTNTSEICHSCKYAIKVKNKDTTFKNHLRQYIWKGGTYDANLTNVEGNPDPKAGQDWCFGYGEEEWLAGKKFEDVKAAADFVTKAGRPQTPVGQVSCE